MIISENIKEAGNILEEDLELNKDLLMMFKSMGIYLSLKSGEYKNHIFDVSGGYNKQLITRIHHLYISGELYLRSFHEVFMISRPSYITDHIFKKFNLRSLSQKETRSLYADDIRLQMEQTNLRKYGVKNPFQSDKIKDKIKKTNLRKYGVSNASSTPEVREKVKQTNLRKYGVKNPFQSDKIKDKIKKTNLRKYGVENPSQNPDIRSKISQTNISRYGGYSLASAKIRSKISRTNMQRYGFPNASSNTEVREKVYNTNNERYGVKSPLQVPAFVEKVKEAWETKDTRYRALREYEKLTLEDRVEIYDEIVRFLFENYSDVQAYDHLKRLELHEPKYSDIEQKVKHILEDLHLRYRYNDRSHGMLLPSGRPFEIDFMLLDHPVAIEVNGIRYHSTEFSPKDRHVYKRVLCNKNSLHFIDLWDFELRDLEQCKLKILDAISFTETPEFNDIRHYNFDSFRVSLHNHPNGRCQYWDSGSLIV